MKKHLFFLFFVVLFLSSLNSLAYAKKIVMNIGFSPSADSEYHAMATKFEALFEKKTQGAIDVRIRCCGQVATEDQGFKALQLGIVDSYLITSNNISPHFPLMDLFVLPYVFKNFDHANRVLEGEVGKAIAEKLQKDTGVYLLSYGIISIRDLYNNKKPINEFKDFSGLKYRVPKNEVMIATFRAFGAEPVPMAWSETPTALQTKTIDGGDNGTTIIEDYKLYEFAEHLTILDHFIGLIPILVSERFVKKLTPEQLKALKESAAEAGYAQRMESYNNINKIRERLVSQYAMKRTDPDRTLFIEAAKKVQADFAAKKGKEFQKYLEMINNVSNEMVRDHN